MKLGISACLHGSLVRYDGTHCKDKFILNTLGKYFDFETYCPEAPIFGVPRDTIRLVEVDDKIRVQNTYKKFDVTDELNESCEEFASKIEKDFLCGFILKSGSPTCGLERVKVYKQINAPTEKKGVGVFAAKIKEKYPYLPVEEDGRLNDAWLRENFLMQVFAYKDLFEFLSSNPKIGDLVEFHSQYKYLIYAKSQTSYKILGSIVANHEKKHIKDILEDYKLAFLKAINEKGSIKKTYNVLLHIMGYFKKLISSEEKQEILEYINDYKSKLIPLIAVINILHLYAKRFSQDYLLKQKFLNPYPKELALRSDIKAFK